LGNSSAVSMEQIADISNWQQHIKLAEKQHGLPVIRDLRHMLKRFPTQPLQHGVAAEGWECFVARGIREAFLENATLKVTIIDSCGRSHSIESFAL